MTVSCRSINSEVVKYEKLKNWKMKCSRKSKWYSNQFFFGMRYLASKIQRKTVYEVCILYTCHYYLKMQKQYVGTQKAKSKAETS